MGKFKTKLILDDATLKSIIKLYSEDKLSTRTIGDSLGVSKTTINNILKDANVEIRKGGRQDTGFDKKAYDKVYHEKNKEKINLYYKDWIKENRDKQKTASDKYRKDNPEKVKERNRNYQTEQRKDPKYRFKNNFKTAVWETLKTKRVTEAFKDLPYSIEELAIHLESLFTPGMNWDNYGEWHIDHIKPQSHFTFESPEDKEFIDCWALSNLQPLWASTRSVNGINYLGNLNKNNKIDTNDKIVTLLSSGNTFNIPIFTQSKNRGKILNQIDIDNIIDFYINKKIGLEQLALDFKVGKKKIVKILKENNVSTRTVGSIYVGSTKTIDARDSYKEIQEKEPAEGKMFVLVCKTTGKMFRDHLNKSGAISNHVKKIHKIEAPNNHFKKIYYLENKKHWFTDYFDLKEIDYFK